MSDQRSRGLAALTGYVCALFTLFVYSSAIAKAPKAEPISYVAHGAMFDATGTQLVPTLPLVGTIQEWY